MVSPFLYKHPTRQDKAIALIAVPYRHSEPITLLCKATWKRAAEAPLHRKVSMHKKFSALSPLKVSPPKEMLSRIKAEAEEAKALYATFTPKRYWNSPFISPLQNPIAVNTVQHVFLTTPCNYHSGVDFRASVGTPIVASNDGVVVIAKERYYAGGSVVIDHGRGGIYSVYYHLKLTSLPR